MTVRLLLVTLGPVQEFIAAARRTRDLWFGSHLLSELARSAARALVEGGARLVFPALEPGDPELEACPAAVRDNGHPPVSIANKILAEVPRTVDPASLGRSAREAARSYWRQQSERVKKTCAPLLAADVEAAWTEQVDSLLEFSAAWAEADTYGGARSQVEQAVASRKLLRDFEPWRNQRGNVEKSSLDGARETVLREKRDRPANLVRRYRIGKDEQLDAVGLVKRAGGEPEQFVPVVNVALAKWIECAAREAKDALDAVRRASEDAGISRVVRKDLPWTEAFPFEASVLLRSRWRSVFDEHGTEEDPMRWGDEHVGPLLRRLDEPYPYVACLVADGDRVGAAISRLASAEAHRAFSGAIANFAGEARRVVEREHLGSLVYAGGDDVLAFLPLPTALDCADALRRRFRQVMEHAAAAVEPAARPTLSVGIGVGHLLESMGELLALGREAERLAKGGREGEPAKNALAVIVDKRSGGRRAWRACWDDWSGDPVARLRQDAEILERGFSHRKVYEVARTLARLPAAPASDDATWSRLLSLDVRRSIARTHAGDRGIDSEAIGLPLETVGSYAQLRARVADWVDRMLVARTFAAAVPRVRSFA